MPPQPPSSLGELLAVDGFKNRRKPSEAAAATRAVSMPPQHRRRSKPARSQSDVLSRRRRDDRNVNTDNGGGGGSDEVATSRRSTLTSERSCNNNNGDGATGDYSLVPPLDEAVLAALVSLVTGAVRRFAKDESFRASLRLGCTSCLGESDHRAVLDLRVVVQTVERAAREALDPRDLQRASLKLQATACLGPKDADAVTAAGVPYPRLAACAHLYMSVISKLQKKNHASAVHTLEAFRWAPHEARTVLLHPLWDRLFRPGLWHLRKWRDKETAAASSETTVKDVEKMFNDVVDEGTRELACYYRDWLLGRTEATALPVVLAPPSTVLGSPTQCSSYEVGSDVVFSSASSSPTRFVASEMLQHSEEAEEEEEEVEDRAVDAESLVHDCDHGEARSHSPTLHDEHAPEHGEEEELIPKKLAKEIFEPQIEHKQCKESDASTSYLLIDDISAKDLLTLEFCYGPLQTDKDGNQVSLFTITPTDFLCPLTRQILTDPVTIATGQTFERAAITRWFNQGIRTCPVTDQELESLSIPDTNSVLKRLIDNWKSEHSKNLTAENARPKEKLTVTIIEKVLSAGCDMSENFEKAKHLMAIGGIDVLLNTFDEGKVEEKARATELLLLCINADGSCRNYVAIRLNSSSVLQLLHSKEISARSAAVCLLIELLCLRRRAIVASFLRDLGTESSMETMQALLEHLQSSPLDDQALVAVLLLHFDILVEPHRNSTYREQAAKCITLALNGCLSEEKLVPNTRKALLLQGGHFSFSGDLLAEDWMLKHAGFIDASRVASVNSDVEKNDIVQDNDEATENERWLKDVTLVLLGKGRRQFLEALSKCLNSPNQDLVAACLTVVGWLSRSLASLDATDIQLAAFSALIPRLKQSLTSTQPTRHRVLASLSLHNFTKIPDCRDLLMLLADGLRDHLTDLAKLTWTAGQLSTELH